MRIELCLKKIIEIPTEQTQTNLQFLWKNLQTKLSVRF